MALERKASITFGLSSMPAPPKFPYPAKVYEPLGRCVYCAPTANTPIDELSKEHIIPFGFGGELILPKASCKLHQKETSRVEDFILRRYLCALRSHLCLPSRNPANRPDGYKLTLRRGSHSWKKKIILADHPGLVRFMMFAEPAGKILGRPREQPTWSVRFIDAEIFPDTKLRLALLGADSFEDTVTINAMSLARFLAKIGHCFAVAELGFDSFEEMYISHLITSESRDWNYWIGGYDRGRNVSARELHELRLLRRGDDLSVIVHLLVPYCPRFAYEVIVGRLRPGVAIAAQLDEGSKG
jgi:hypothetical protein